MAFDGICMANVTKELNDTILNARIVRIAQPETDELLLTLKTTSGQRRLSISADASLPLIHLAESNKPSPMTAPNFCMLLRKHINGGRIIRITQPGLERIIRFEIEHLDELGDLSSKELIVEIMGKHSNIIFCTPDGLIIDSIKHVSAQMSSIREILPGRTYFIPDTQAKLNPLDVSEEAFLEQLMKKPMPLGKALYNSFTGISPVYAEELCFASALPSDVPSKELPTDHLRHLYRQFCICFEAVKNGEFSPAIYFNGQEPQEFSSLPLTHFPALSRKEFSSVSELLETYYSTRSRLTRVRQKSADLRHIVSTALERSRKKYELQLRQLKDTEKRDKYRVYGELLNVYGYDIKEGSRELKALNYYTNQELTIPLDPQKTPLENAQKYFERYNKLKRTYEALSGISKETLEEIHYLESLENSLSIAQGEADLTQLREELAESGYIRHKGGKKKTRMTSKPFHYISSDGFDMYVGKNNLQNDELTFHFADGGDWWFHAKNTPGSHVIVKTGGKELPDRTFEEAGRLAAHYSKAKSNEKTEVDYVRRKEVKKPKGAKPGFVVYYTNYSMLIDSDISGLKEVE